MDGLTHENLIATYRYELQRVYGKEYSQACIVEFCRSWFYIYYPIKEGKRYKVNPLSKPIRSGELIRMIEELKSK